MSVQRNSLPLGRFGPRRGDGTVNMPADAPYSARVDRLNFSDHPDRRFTDAVDLDFVRDLELVRLRFTGFELRASGPTHLERAGVAAGTPRAFRRLAT